MQPGQDLSVGDMIVFTVETENCGENPMIQWQYSSDNITWHDVPDAHANTHSFELDEDNFLLYWRAGIIITD